jgi:hypothetical protein
MTFRVGQKVVRVAGVQVSDVPPPPLNTPVTVSNVYMTPVGELAVEILEYPAPETDEYFAGFAAEKFRPVVERKTDISIFQRMLSPNKETVHG